MPVTMHDCTSWNVHRATLIEYAHEVDGVGFIGGRGQRLDSLIEQTYREEASQLASDLAVCLAALPAPVAHEVLETVKPILGHAAGARHDVRGTVPITHEVPVVDVDGFDAPAGNDAFLSGDDPVDEPKRGRGRRQDDAAAALADQREEGSGEIILPADLDAVGTNDG